MEVRGKDKELLLRMASASAISSTVGEERRGDEAAFSITPPPSLHQLSLQQQSLNGSDDPNSDPDPVFLAPPIVVTATVAGATSRQNLNSGSQESSPVVDGGDSRGVIVIRYRECQKNHAASMGGHVVDGCGEFMPRGEEGTADAFKCAACNCHRNFHRKDTETEARGEEEPLPLQHPNSFYPYNNPTRNNNNSTITNHHQHRRRNSLMLQMPSPPLHQHHHKYPYPLLAHHGHAAPSNIAQMLPISPVMVAFGSGGGAPADSSSEGFNAAAVAEQAQFAAGKKRYRTKFSQEQKDKMMELAEKLEWKIQKQDEQQVQHFCSEVGVKRQVFKVWMHNNKHAMKKKQ